MTRENAALTGLFAVLCVAVFVLGGRQLDAPGLYYDEVIQATPASEFLREGGEPLSIPGAQNTWLFGGWFPVLTQPYMGALKSQLLIPSFAVFGTSRETLRLVTLAWSCIGLGLLALWTRRMYGPAAAALVALLVALDPSFLFVSRHDWGSVSLAMVCRGGGLLWLAAGWERRSVGRLAVGGLLMGLGLYNKIDFVGFLAGAGIALVLTVPRVFWGELRRRTASLSAVTAGFAIGAAPMLLAVTGILSATQAMLRSQQTRSDAISEKIATWTHMLDGSYFHRLMLSGGRFDGLTDVHGAASGPFLWLFAVSVVGLGLWLWRDARDGRPWRAQAFAWLSTFGIAAILLLIPRAARIHHTMNVYPFPHLVVALFLVRLWTARPGSAWIGRGLATAATAAIVLGNVWIDTRILETLAESGGRGRWSGALEEWVQTVPNDATVVSLDWGFHAPLLFLRPDLSLEEPVWKIHVNRDRPFKIEGTPDHVYLVQEQGYEVFPIGAALLDAATRLPMGDVRIVKHVDRRGGTSFVSIQFARPHQLVYRGSFEVRLK